MSRDAIAQRFRADLGQRRRADPDYWTFRHNAVRRHAHAFLQYPAMMVPQMQGELIAAACRADSTVRKIYDPFVGSGTVMVEAMLRGLDFAGFDINPLAVLICRAKEGPFFPDAMYRRCLSTLSRVEKDRGTRVDVDFPNIHKWFTDRAAVELSRVRRAIRAERMQWARRFLWLSLAETVRLTSNSRTSTFKLHIRPRQEIRACRISPVSVFGGLVRENLDRFKEITDALRARGRLLSGRYRGTIETDLRDARTRNGHSSSVYKYDLLVTSPPYGDNVSTVPYGQYSYLLLNWVDLEDITPAADRAWIRTTHEIDFRSLGGSRVLSEGVVPCLSRRSRTFRETISSLKDRPRDRAQRIAAFCRDLDCCLDPILEQLKPGALMIWTVGNRKVGGRAVPMDSILEDLLVSRGARPVVRLQRTIPNKRMAVKNSISKTMRSESVVVMQKDGG